MGIDTCCVHPWIITGISPTDLGGYIGRIPFYVGAANRFKARQGAGRQQMNLRVSSASRMSMQLAAEKPEEHVDDEDEDQGLEEEDATVFEAMQALHDLWRAGPSA